MSVSFELADAYTNDVREVISSGLRTTFAYDVDLRMMAPLWVDRTIATASVNVSDQYDNLTRRHTLQRTVDGRVQDSIVTEDDTIALDPEFLDQREVHPVQVIGLCTSEKDRALGEWVAFAHGFLPIRTQG